MTHVPIRRETMRSRPIVFFAIILFFVAGSDLFADSTIDFEDAATGLLFEGDGDGDTAGPILIDAVNTIFTTGFSSGPIATSSFGLGIDSGGGDPDPQSFNINEEWSFFADQNLFLIDFELGGLQSEETFFIQSDEWINLANITTGTGVTYESATGTFGVTDGPADDKFTLNELTGGPLLEITSGTVVTFGNLTSTFGPNDDVELQSITFQFNPIPEPSMFFVVCVSSCVLSCRRKRS